MGASRRKYFKMSLNATLAHNEITLNCLLKLNSVICTSKRFTTHEVNRVLEEKKEKKLKSCRLHSREIKAAYIQ